jgi:hypothetical protein
MEITLQAATRPFRAVELLFAGVRAAQSASRSPDAPLFVSSPLSKPPLFAA